MNTLSLFYSNKERTLFFGVLTAIFLLNIFYYYTNFQDLKKNQVNFLKAKVITQYQKENDRGTYWVLKLKAEDGYSFYTTSREDLKDIAGRVVTIGILTSQIEFIGYIKGFYAISVFIALDKPNSGLADTIKQQIYSQHLNNEISEFYSSILLGTPISKELRESVTNLGIAHLIAISGFHIGIIAGIITLILLPVYSFFQNRFFPYRNKYLDLYLITGVLILGYTTLTGFIPSLVRSYAMFLFGGFLVFRNIKILNYENLFVVGLVLMAIFPKLLFSLGFFFSMAGVFYIYLLINYIQVKNKFVFSVILSFLLFVYMLPLSFYFFNKVSYYQMLSPLLTVVFPLFYPVIMILHLVGQGGIFDRLLIYLFSLKNEFWDVDISSTLFGLYLLNSIMSMYGKKIFYLFSIFSFILLLKFYLFQF